MLTIGTRVVAKRNIPSNYLYVPQGTEGQVVELTKGAWVFALFPNERGRGVSIAVLPNVDVIEKEAS